jgi:hypothetical protein
MSSLKKSRITKLSIPEKAIKRHKYSGVLSNLMQDFDGRCAYSMQHHTRAGKLEVDHFNPKLKKDLLQNYANLFPASRHCNGAKSDHWPTAAEAAVGCRFLNPREEMDYGTQIFEDSESHVLSGITPAAKWHIRMCGLNAPHLVHERAKRAEYCQLLRRTAVIIKRDSDDLREQINAFKNEVELMIPEIPFFSLGELGRTSPIEP